MGFAAGDQNLNLYVKNDPTGQVDRTGFSGGTDNEPQNQAAQDQAAQNQAAEQQNNALALAQWAIGWAAQGARTAYRIASEYLTADAATQRELRIAGEVGVRSSFRQEVGVGRSRRREGAETGTQLVFLEKDSVS